MADPADLVPAPTDADLERINGLLRTVGGANVSWGAAAVLDVLLTERRIEAERLVSDRLTRATWVLAASTIVLALATVILIFVTIGQ